MECEPEQKEFIEAAITGLWASGMAGIEGAENPNSPIDKAKVVEHALMVSMVIMSDPEGMAKDLQWLAKEKE